MSMTDLEKSQFQLALMCGLDRNHTIMSVLWPTPEDLSEFMVGDRPEVTKETLFSTFSVKDGVDKMKADSFFAYKEVLAKMPEILAGMKDQGVMFEASDFTETLVRGKGALLLAEDEGNFTGLMDPEFWAGRMDDLQKLYDTLPASAHDKVDIGDLKRQAAHAAGIKLREDVLAEAGIEIGEINTACKTGKLDDIVRRMEHAGLSLEKEDLFLANVFVAKESWTHYEHIHGQLLKAGERMELDDFNRQLQEAGSTLKKSVLETAAKHELAKPVLKPELWIGRGLELETLLSSSALAASDVRTKNKIKPDEILAKLADLEYGGAYENPDFSSLTRDELTQPISPAVSLKDAFEGKESDETPVMPLGVATLWKHGKDLRKAMKNQDTPIEPEHLLAITSYGGETALMTAVRAGQIRSVMDIFRDADMVITPGILERKNEHGETALDMLSAQDLKEIVFDPQYWVGHASDMKALHEKVPVATRNTIAIDDLLRSMNRADVIRRAEKVAFDPYAGGPA